MTEESNDYPLEENDEDDQPIDLSKNSSSTRFQEHIRREAEVHVRPVPLLIPLNLMSSTSSPSESSEENLVAMNGHCSGLPIGRNRLARVQSYPYLLTGHRKLTASQKSKSESRISTASAQLQQSYVDCWNLSNNERLSQLLINSPQHQNPVQNLSSEETPSGQDLRNGASTETSGQQISPKSVWYGRNVRRGAGASPSVINSLRTYLKKKQQIQQSTAAPCSNKQGRS